MVVAGLAISLAHDDDGNDVDDDDDDVDDDNKQMIN